MVTLLSVVSSDKFVRVVITQISMRAVRLVSQAGRRVWQLLCVYSKLFASV